MAIKFRPVLLCLAGLTAATVYGSSQVVLSYTEQKRETDPGVVSGASYLLNNYDDTASKYAKYFASMAREATVASNTKILEFTKELQATEEGRRQLEAQRADVEKNRYAALQAYLAEQKRLEEKAKQEAALEQATPIPDKTTGVTPPTELPQSPPPVVSPSTSVELPDTTPSPIEEMDYFGQFEARFICTCTSCFDFKEHPGVKVGDRFAMCSSEYIPDGAVVEFDMKSVGEYTVRELSDTSISGRVMLVYTPEHDLIHGGMVWFPKVSRKVAEGLG